MTKTKNEVLKSVTADYLSTIDINKIPQPNVIEATLLDKINEQFKLENSVKKKGRHWKYLTELPNAVIADIIIKTNFVKRLFWANNEREDNYDLVIYQAEGENKGIYIADKNALRRLIQCYNYSITTKDSAEIIRFLSVEAPACTVNFNPDLIAVNNGIFNYATKELLPFSPDIVFTSKSSVNYVETTSNVIIHHYEDNTDWDIESWMSDLSDDHEIVSLLWEILGAIIRPHVSWDKVICLYSNTENNGKETLCQLMRKLCGDGNYANLPFSNFGKDFMLQILTRVPAIITDENNSKSFTTANKTLKAVITGNTFTIRRKFIKPITTQFRGLIVQCVNDLPRFQDKTDSFYRRFLIIPFSKCFTDTERKYIQNDYLCRQEILEYVLHKVLNTSYYKFSVPDA